MIRKFKKTFVALAVASVAGSALAGVTAEEAKQLGTTLTGTGAERAGNKEGTIPAYTGGLTTPPAGFKKGDGIRPDPYASDKPLYTIDAKNMDKYADKLTEGVKGIMKQYPEFRVDVYPTHRSVAYPQSIVDNTAKNATRAKTSQGGLVIDGAHAGVPFPIPKDGYEVMWNHLLRYEGQAFEMKFRSMYVDAGGTTVLATEGSAWQEYPYYDQTRTSTDTYYKIKIAYNGPARRAGEALMVHDPLNPMEKGRRAWQYLPGQRRVKLAPDVSYDTPNPGTAGATTYDDAFLFNGAMDRFDFKLVGKKEMFIPYNSYRVVYQSKEADLFKPKFMNPDVVRWELHRVWVVEATLKEGKRHIYSKRRFYLDEDSWIAVAAESYDARGALYRVGLQFPTTSYDVQTVYADTTAQYDLIAGLYAVIGWPAETGGVRYTPPLPEREWMAEQMAGAGIR